MNKAPSKANYIPSLDGIRAIAVTLVVVSHAGFDRLIPGGFGVTIFFFLSGYLITTLLRQEWEKTRWISLKGFYLRRIYRIFPPLYVVLAIVTMLTVAGVVGDGKPINISSIASQLLFATNYYAIVNGESHFLPGTAVLWSLAIEEHFYFVFPVALLILLRRHSYKYVARTLIGVCLLVLMWRVFLVFVLHVDDIYTYMASDARADSLLWGCVLGLVFNPHLDNAEPVGGAGKIAVFVAAMSILLFCLLYRNEDFRETARYSLQGLALWPMFWLAIRHHDWAIFRPLNWWVLRWLGRISYTLYLIHLTGYNLAARLVDDRVSQIVLGISISIAFSVAMYFLVERKFMYLRKRLHRESLE